ncbi:MAG: hypothetical protein WCQ95_04160 [Bacteroidota bacterium]
MKFTLTIKKYLFLLLVIFMPIWSAAQNASASASIDTNNVLIGDHIKYTYKASFPAKARIDFPFITDTLSKSVEVISRTKFDTLFSSDKKRITYSQTLSISCYDSGSFVIPPLIFRYTMPGDTAKFLVNTLPIILNINTIAVDTTKAIKDIKGPLHEPITLREILIWGSIILGSLLVIGLIIFIIWKLRRKEKIIDLKLRPKIPPHEKALRELEKLKNEKLWQSGMIKEFHSSLTDILRVYIEERFETIAMEMTTYDIITSLKTKVAESEELKKLEHILVLADMVKFAKYNPIPDEHDISMRNAIVFVEDTKPEKLIDQVHEVIIDNTEQPKTE